MTEILTPEVIQSAVNDYLAAGGTVTRIEQGEGRYFSDPESRVVLNRWGHKGPNEERERLYARIRSLHQKGMPGLEIVARLKVSRSVVRRVLHAAVDADPTTRVEDALHPAEVRRRKYAGLDTGSMTRAALREHLGGVTWDTIVNDAAILRRRGVKVDLPPPPVRRSRGEVYADLMVNGMSIADIAARFGASEDAVRARLVEYVGGCGAGRARS